MDINICAKRGMSFWVMLYRDCEAFVKSVVLSYESFDDAIRNKNRRRICGWRNGMCGQGVEPYPGEHHGTENSWQAIGST